MHKRILFAAALAAAAAVCPAHATLSSTATSVTYTGNGATTAYTVTFKFLSNSDLVVTVAGVTKTLTTHYTVTGAGNATGTVTFVTAPANAAAVVISRSVDGGNYKQTTSLASSRTYDPRTVETAIDKLTMEAQELRATVTSPPASVLPANVTAKLNGIRFADQFSNIQAAITDASTTGAVLIPSSYVGSDTYSNPNNVPIIDLRNGAAGWRGRVSVKDFGAVGNGVADDTVAIAAANTALPSSGGEIYFPAGTYKFNLTILKGGVVISGGGYGDVNTGIGGTKFIAANVAQPILTIGDGATANIRGVIIQNVILVGDGASAANDGIYIFGARDISLQSVVVTGFGRDGIRILCGAQSASGIYMSALALSANRGSSLKASYCAGSFTTDISVVNSHINGWATGAARSIYLDSVTLWLANTYIDIPASAQGHIEIRKSFAATPGIGVANGAFDNSAGAAATTLDVSTWLAKASRLSSAINGTFLFVGDVVYSDGTVQEPNSRGGYYYQPAMLNPNVLNQLYLPLDEADIAANTVGVSRTGTSGGGFEFLNLSTARLSVTGVQHPPVTVTYSAAMTLDLSAGSIFEITPNNGTAFSITTTRDVNGQPIVVRIINTTGGALGAATFTGMSTAGAWVQPGTGNNRSITLYRSAAGGKYYETSRSAADVLN